MPFHYFLSITMEKLNIAVIIPALNEEGSIADVIREIPEIVEEVVVTDNRSTDNTAEVARQSGATVLYEPQRGYGYACLKAIDYLKDKSPDIVVFLDADYSDYPEELTKLVQPIIEDSFDFVLGSRINGDSEKGAMEPQQIFGNILTTTLIRWIFDFRYTDLGPFRAIRFDKLLALGMEDQTYGWTVEMQIKALKQNLKIKEIPVSYRKRAAGKSKISGTISGTIKAGYKIISTVFKYTV